MMRIYLMMTSIAVVVAIGCQDKHHDDSIRSDSHPQAMANDVKLTGLPQSVSDAFTREHPNATVSTVAPLQTQGPPMYRIVYVQNGAPGEVTYRYDGTRYNPPPRPPAPKVGY
jgi:hypothetical protein